MLESVQLLQLILEKWQNLLLPKVNYLTHNFHEYEMRQKWNACLVPLHSCSKALHINISLIKWFSPTAVLGNKGKHNPHTTTTTTRDENAFLRPWERDVVAYMCYCTVRSFFTLTELLLSHPRLHSTSDKHPCQNKCHETEVAGWHGNMLKVLKKRMLVDADAGGHVWGDACRYVHALNYCSAMFL